MLPIALAAGLVVAAGLAAWAWQREHRSRDRLLAGRLRDRFVVTVESGETFVGLLGQVDERTVILHEAAALAANGDRTAVDGELYLPRGRVAYMQRP